MQLALAATVLELVEDVGVADIAVLFENLMDLLGAAVEDVLQNLDLLGLRHSRGSDWP